MKIICDLCPHHCQLDEGQTGFCKARTNQNGKTVCSNYGRLTSIALDRIEKKPLQRYYPGSKILSVGSYGCNLRCPFCQNYEISMEYEGVRTIQVLPKQLVNEAVELMKEGNIGIAFTYNEPLISYEYVYDTSVLAHKNNLKNILVTNGTICREPLERLLPHIDAMNIDLKGFSKEYYDMIQGDFETVMSAIKLATEYCHVEITTLIVPGKNDSEEEMKELSKWLASINKEIPLHISRFFPRYKMIDIEATPVEKIYRLRDIAKENLKYVYTGNI